jgi:4-hydroxybenzoate polyprenyltransferase
MSFFSVVIALFKVNGIYLFEFNFSNRGGVKAENLLVSFVFCTRFADKCVAVNKLYVQDIPDIEGDKIFGIQSFTVRLGQKWVSLEHIIHIPNGELLASNLCFY